MSDNDIWNGFPPSRLSHIKYHWLKNDGEMLWRNGAYMASRAAGELCMRIPPGLRHFLE